VTDRITMMGNVSIPSGAQACEPEFRRRGLRHWLGERVRGWIGREERDDCERRDIEPPQSEGLFR
jgi:hypothetical protein